MFSPAIDTASDKPASTAKQTTGDIHAGGDVTIVQLAAPAAVTGGGCFLIAIIGAFPLEWLAGKRWGQGRQPAIRANALSR